jgi:UDP-N-acetylglucosamine 3-dehydrogenase
VIRVGVIGLGSMGKNHVRVYSELPDVELIGIADLDDGIARGLAEKYHTKPFTDYKDLLKQDLDAVSIAVNTSSHHEVAMCAARSGMNMLVEKPIATTIQEAQEIIKAAESNKIKLMVGLVERYNPVIPIIKREIEGAEVCLIEITRIGPFPPRVKDIGIVTDLATHDIDLLRYLTGSEVKNLHSVISKNIAHHEDTAILIFEMANGILARVTVNWLTPFKVREINVATKEKFIKASLIGGNVSVCSRFKEDESSYVVREVTVPRTEPLKQELRAFIESVRDNVQPPVSGEDALKALEVAILCLSQKNGVG